MKVVLYFSSAEYLSTLVIVLMCKTVANLYLRQIFTVQLFDWELLVRWRLIKGKTTRDDAGSDACDVTLSVVTNRDLVVRGDNSHIEVFSAQLQRPRLSFFPVHPGNQHTMSYMYTVLA